MTKLIKRKGERNEHDHYPTPQYLANWLVSQCLLSAQPHDETCLRVLEPGCGDTAPFLRAVAEQWDGQVQLIGCDIRHSGRDFVTEERQSVNHYDLVITNPPFNKSLEFWQRSVELAHPLGEVAFIVKTSFLQTIKRSEQWAEHNPSRIYFLYPRPSFSADGKTDIAQEYCAIRWRKNMESGPTIMNWVDLRKIRKQWG